MLCITKRRPTCIIFYMGITSCVLSISLSTKILGKTVARQTGTCAANEFACTSEIKCISDTWFCDGVNDCVGSEDEKNCPEGIDNKVKGEARKKTEKALHVRKAAHKQKRSNLLQQYKQLTTKRRHLAEKRRTFSGKQDARKKTEKALSARKAAHKQKRSTLFQQYNQLMTKRRPIPKKRGPENLNARDNNQVKTEHQAGRRRHHAGT